MNFDGRGKHYIRKGFNQLYIYMQQYNQHVGYLVIYKTVDRDLHLALKRTSNIPVVSYNSKNIYILIIDIHPYNKPASQRSPLQPFEITEDELEQADEYEASASYKRIMVTLHSGTTAWVYISADSQ